jgi:hypothetical protein
VENGELTLICFFLYASSSWNIILLPNIQNGLLSTDTNSYFKGSYEIIGKYVPDGELSRASSTIC